MADTGTYKVTEAYLTDFANTKIQNFLDSATKDPAVLTVNEFASGNGGGQLPGNYSKILGGNSTVFAPAQQLQDGFKAMAASMQTQLNGLHQTMSRTQIDLRQVHAVMENGETNAELSAGEMTTDLGDVLNPGGGTISTPTTTSSPPPPTTSTTTSTTTTSK